MKTRTLMTGAALAGTLTLAACGSSSSGDGVASANGGDNGKGASPSPSVSRDLTKWAACMRQNGVRVSDPQTGGNALSPERAGVSQEKLKQALQACQRYVTGSTTQAPDSTRLDAFVKLARCIREHGYDMPDPQLDANGEMTFPKKIDRSSPAFKKAREACKSLRPKSNGWQGGGS